jgi:hypothetical protein
MQSLIYLTQTNSPNINHKYQILIDRLYARLETAQSTFNRRLVQQLNDELIYLQSQL